MSGEKLKALRTQHNLSERALADLLHVRGGYTTIKNWEADRPSPPPWVIPFAELATAAASGPKWTMEREDLECGLLNINIVDEQGRHVCAVQEDLDDPGRHRRLAQLIVDSVRSGT